MKRVWIRMVAMSVTPLCRAMQWRRSLLKFILFGVAAHVFMMPMGVSFAQSPEASSGENARPEGATTITQTKDSRWVSYDRQDQTDWLTIVPPNVTDSQLILRINFTRVDGPILVEVYGENPSGEILEQREIRTAEVYEYQTAMLKQYYVRLYAVGPDSQAQYEFNYLLTPLPPTPTPIPTFSPTPTIALSVTPTTFPSATSTETPLATPMLVSSPAGDMLSPTPTPIIPPAKTTSDAPEARQAQPFWSLSLTNPFVFWGLIGGLTFGLLLVMIMLFMYARLKKRLKKPTSANDLLMSSEYQTLGDMAAERGKLALAEKCYRKVAEFEPDNLDVRYQIGVFLIQMQRYKDAIAEFQKYLRGEIIRSEAYVYLAYAYLQIRNLDKSQEYYEKARALDQSDPNVYVGLGVIAQTREQYAQAKRHYEHALTLDPRCQEARKNLEQIDTFQTP